MTDQEPKAWEYREHSLIVLPGLSWEEWSSLWATVEQTHKSAAFWTGDALLAGQEQFGERFSQVVDPNYIHQQKGPMWVCARIEPARRRASLSYSMHKALAALDRADQDRWLDRAEAEHWTVRDLRAAMEAEARGGNGGPPLSDEEAAAYAEASSTWNDPLPDPAQPDTFGAVEDVAGEPLQAPPAHVEPAPPPEHPAQPSPAPTAPVAPQAEILRGCIADLRALAPKLLRTHVDTIVRLEDRVTDALGLEPGALSLLNTETVLKLLPPGWGYAVTLTKPGEQIAVGLGPSLACAVVESILAARLSDMGAG